MSQSHRLPQGGRIDRSRTLRFTFNGKPYEGHSGDTLASALLANGVTLVARSWKYHRPRGIVAAGVEEPNAIVQLETGARTVPNARATEVELYDGLVAASVNCWPSPEVDLMGVTGLFSRLMPAGFYYKTFMWPKSFWMRYEHYIRKASGLGRAPEGKDPDRYAKRNAWCDVLVAGAGRAGIEAALQAGRAGQRVILADEQAEPGGALLGDVHRVLGGVPAAQWLQGALTELAAMPHVTILPRSTVFGYHDGNFLTIAQRLADHLPLAERGTLRERVWRVRAKEVVLATGAIERPLVFADNDLPGVMLASAVSRYTSRYGVRLGSRAVVFTNNDSAYRAALDLQRAGVAVTVVDSRTASLAADAAKTSGMEVLMGAVVTQASGNRRVSGVRIRKGDAERTLECDLLAVSGGWSPAVHLHAHSGGRPVFDEAKACFVPGKATQPQRSTGSCNGDFSRGEGTVQPLWLVPGPTAAKQFVDYQSDVTAADIALAAREGYRSIEHVKRYTALGFGTDQGKLGNINGMAILAQCLGQSIAATGTTTFRPNYTPVTFGALAGPDLGDLFEPIRTTTLHAWHVAHGALFENVGQWKRPWYFPKPGEDLHAAVNRECLAARNGVAMMDASTLGKIDIQGPDAAAFLNMVYTNAWLKLGVGKCRYGLMLDENGMVMDDGVTTRLAENHFLMTTTTGGAARVMTWLERWLQTEWPHLKVYLTSVTEHFATAAVVGPKSREVLQAVCKDLDFSPAAFPFMSSFEGTVAGVPARIMRISFSGELAYEVNVRADRAPSVWEALFAAGEPFGITPYGTETMHVLRAEKGFIIVGQDTDGSVTPVDLGMDWIIAKGKDFLGRRSLLRSDTVRDDRKHLVGLLAEDPATVLPEGAQIVSDARAAVPVPMLGHVTSSYFSAFLQRSIAMALVKNGRKRMGEKVELPLADGRVLRATIASPVFVDPEGARQNA
jgi:sarcosine oxidase subunit alpha